MTQQNLEEAQYGMTTNVYHPASVPSGLTQPIHGYDDEVDPSVVDAYHPEPMDYQPEPPRRKPRSPAPKQGGHDHDHGHDHSHGHPEALAPAIHPELAALGKRLIKSKVFWISLASFVLGTGLLGFLFITYQRSAPVATLDAVPAPRQNSDWLANPVRGYTPQDVLNQALLWMDNEDPTRGTDGVLQQLEDQQIQLWRTEAVNLFNNPVSQCYGKDISLCYTLLERALINELRAAKFPMQRYALVKSWILLQQAQTRQDVNPPSAFNESLALLVIDRFLQDMSSAEKSSLDAQINEHYQRRLQDEGSVLYTPVPVPPETSPTPAAPPAPPPAAATPAPPPPPPAPTPTPNSGGDAQGDGLPSVSSFN